MPATFPSHAAAALPFKLWKPRHFDGVALVVGSAAPDGMYAFYGLGFAVPHTHGWLDLFWWCLPFTLVVTALIRWAAPVVVAQLPDGGILHLKDYGALGSVRYKWYVTTYSALLGAATHVFWDSFTHDPQGHGWAVRYVSALNSAGPFDLPWFRTLQQMSTLLGAFVFFALIVHIGRKRLLQKWHGPAPYVEPRNVLFWSVTAIFVMMGLIALPYLPQSERHHVLGVRILYVVALSLLAAAAAVVATDHIKSRQKPRVLIPANRTFQDGNCQEHRR